VKTVKNVRSDLAAAGLVRSVPDKDESGQVLRWLVRRTNAPRKPDPDTTDDHAGFGSTTPLPVQTPTHTVGNWIYLFPGPDPGGFARARARRAGGRRTQ